MAAGRVPGKPGGGVTAGAIIDGTGASSTVPLTILNGKNASGLVIQVTGTAPSGVVFNDSSGVAKGSVGYAVAAGDWVTGSLLGSVVLQASNFVYIRGQNTGVRIVSQSGSGVIYCDESLGARLQYGTNLLQIDSNITFSSGQITNTRGNVLNTSGAQAGFQNTATFAPTSGTCTFRSLDNAYTVNQTGGANGAIHGLRIAATETAVVGTHTLIEALAGAAGSTLMFKVDNTGKIYSGLASIALGGGAAPTFGTIGGSGPAASAQNKWGKLNFGGTDYFLPLWI